MQLPPQLVSREVRDVISAIDPGRPDRVRFYRQDFDTVFARDNAKAGTRGGRRVLVVPRRFGRPGRRGMDDLRRRRSGRVLGRPVVSSRLDWVGGNLLVTGRHLIVGADTIVANRRRLGGSSASIRNAFEREFGLPVLVLGDPRRQGHQPDYHLDLSIAVLERQDPQASVALVADAVAGARLARRKTPRTLARHVAGQFVDAPDAVRLALRTWRDSATRRAPLLQRYCEQLDQAGYEVYRVPDLHVTDRETRLYGSALSTFSTNVVPAGQCGTVYALRFGFPQLERAVGRAFATVGWRLTYLNRSLPAAWELQRLGGGLHCLCGDWE